jgi:hypothetical protein
MYHVPGICCGALSLSQYLRILGLCARAGANMYLLGITIINGPLLNVCLFSFDILQNFWLNATFTSNLFSRNKWVIINNGKKSVRLFP